MVYTIVSNGDADDGPILYTPRSAVTGDAPRMRESIPSTVLRKLPLDSSMGGIGGVNVPSNRKIAPGSPVPVLMYEESET